METVNALKVRNNLGEILDRLSATGEPILVSKGKELRAVLVTPQDFEKRFLDYRVKEDKKRLLNSMTTLKRKKKYLTTYCFCHKILKLICLNPFMMKYFSASHLKIFVKKAVLVSARNAVQT